jgi:hypothetical protein
MIIVLSTLPAFAAEVAVDFSKDIKSAGLKVNSVKYELKGDMYQFLIDCESDAARGYSLFNPPGGDKLKKVIFNDGIKAGSSVVKIEAEKNAVDSITGNIVMKFWKNNEDGDDYISFLLKPAAAQPVQSEPEVLTALPVFDPAKKDDWQIDLRNRDLSKFELDGRTADLLRADFDSLTKWPEKMPAGFTPEKIMQMGKDPGLRVRELHKNKITGLAISIAIIDQKLDTTHIEFADRLKVYEEIHCLDGQPQMHGSAVSSIAAGRTLGVAPEASLYYIAETHGTYSNGAFDWDYTFVASSIERILEINRSLAAPDKIRVISISLGFTPDKKGYKEVMAAIENAKKDNVFVVSSSLEEVYGYKFDGLGREPLSEPNDFNSYLPGCWWEKNFYETPNYHQKPALLVPMDARCTASETGSQNYVFYRSGGWSWSIPYIAGLYALACQVSPSMTPEKFWQAALQTGDKITITKDGKKYPLGLIANPVKIIEALK